LGIEANTCKETVTRQPRRLFNAAIRRVVALALVPPDNFLILPLCGANNKSGVFQRCRCVRKAIGGFMRRGTLSGGARGKARPRTRRFRYAVNRPFAAVRSVIRLHMVLAFEFQTRWRARHIYKEVVWQS